MRAQRVIAVAGVLLAACGRPAERASRTVEVKAVPVAEEPRHHLVFANELVNVLDVLVPAGDTTSYHVHAHPLAGVALRYARDWEQQWGGPPDSVETPAPAPELFDNWDLPLPYTHRVGNADSVFYHYIAAEWLKSSGIACPRFPDSPARRLVKVGPTALLYELRIPAHSVIPRHVHRCPGLIVQGTAGSLKTDAPAPAAAGGAGEGAWRWHAPGYPHGLQNLGDSTVIVYELEWR